MEAYTLRVLFVDPCGEKYDGGTLRKRGLGGSESAVIWVSEALASLGHDVRVYNTVENPGVYNGVHFYPFADFPLEDHHEIVIALRRPSSLSCVQADLKILWIHDIFQPGYQDLEHYIKKGEIHKIFCLSQFQKRDFLEQSATTDGDYFLTRNGCPQPDYVLRRNERDTNKFIYASRADRGLQYLLLYWPSILKIQPDAQLHVFDYRLKSGSGDAIDTLPLKEKPPTFDMEHMEGIFGDTELSVFEQEYEGIYWRGALRPDELINEIKNAYMLLYPNVYPETSCIVAHMAVSCATPIITSDFGALPELINNRNGALIKETPRTNSNYKRQFLEAFKNLLKEKVWQAKHEYSLRYKLSWLDVAREWDDFFRTNVVLRGKFKILVGVPTRNKRSAIEQQHIKEIDAPVGAALHFMEVPEKDVASAREDICDRALDEGFAYILFVDDDNIVPRQTPKILLETKEDLVSLNYYKKTEISNETAGYLADTLADARVSNERLPEVYVAGMGCTLIKTEILRKIGKPYFRNTHFDPYPGGEDVHFFAKCRIAGIRPRIFTKTWALHRDLKTGKLFGPSHLINEEGKALHSWMKNEYAGLSLKDLYDGEND